jgi:proteic killer suppression protein
MDIRFADRKLERECNDSRLLRRRQGERRANLVRLRLGQLRAAEVLADVRKLPGARCHELVGDRKNTLSVDLDHPYRLLFSPDHDPIPTKADGGIDWSWVRAIVIHGIEDTHG